VTCFFEIALFRAFGLPLLWAELPAEKV
jgi:hypothetical protein